MGCICVKPDTLDIPDNNVELEEIRVINPPEQPVDFRIRHGYVSQPPPSYDEVYPINNNERPPDYAEIYPPPPYMEIQVTEL